MAIRLEKNVELDDVSKKVAVEELRESPERIREATLELRKLLQENSTIHFDDSDEFLLRYLRPCKFYPEGAFALFERTAEFRKKHAEVLAGISPTADKGSLLNTKVVNVLVDRDQNRRRILIMNVGGIWDPKQLDTDKLFRLLYLVHFGAMMEPVTQVHGAIIIMDFTGLSLKQVKSFTPNFSLRLLSFIQDAMPIRLKAVHIVFQPYMFKVVWAIFRPFIREKLSKRIMFHGSNLKTLHKHIDIDCLPADYGGTKPKIDYSSADWYPVLAELDDTIKVWQSYGFVQNGKIQ